MSTPKFIFLQLPADGSVAAGADWVMWSAIATVAATAVALFLPLFLHFHAERTRRRDHARQVDRRTRDVGPQLAGDVTQIQWSLEIMMRKFMRAVSITAFSRPGALSADFAAGELTIAAVPGGEVFPGDIGMLADPVREHLAALKAQVAVLNAMTRRVVEGSHEPYATRQESVQIELFLLANQLVATATRGISLMAALEPYLDAELNALNDRFRTLAIAHLRSLLTIAEIRNREVPDKRVDLLPISADLSRRSESSRTVAASE
jgi:hypothetical protein